MHLYIAINAGNTDVGSISDNLVMARVCSCFVEHNALHITLDRQFVFVDDTIWLCTAVS